MTTEPKNSRTVVEVPERVFDALIEGMKKIDRMERALETNKVLSSTEWLTVDEFLTKVKVSRWKFEAWKDHGLIQIKKIGKKWYVHPSEVQRYYNNEIGTQK